VRRPRSRPSSAWRRTISRPICQYTSISSALIARAALADDREEFVEGYAVSAIR
jgi:hypothetical protein